jgi:flagellar hook protein FlgE
MAIFAGFVTSTLGMLAQSHALNVIGANIANLTTGGYKKTDTEFKTVLSEQLLGDAGLGGTRPKDLQRIDVQGQIQTTSNDLDAAILGDGFFMVSPTLQVSSRVFFTRDGSFEISTDNPTTTGGVTTFQGFLVDKNGFYLLGWAPQADGTFSNTGATAPMRVDAGAFTNVGQPSTTAELVLNLPANNAVTASHATAVANFNAGSKPAGMETFNINVIDNNGTKQNARLNFTKSALNTWQVSATTGVTAVAQVDTATIAGTVEAGDSYSVTINGTTVTYNVTGAEANLAAVRTALVAAINANAAIPVTAAAGAAAGQITLTADSAGTAFTATAAAVNGGATADNTATIANTTANVSPFATTAVTTVPFTKFGLAGTASAGAPNGVTPPANLSLALSFGAQGGNPAGTATLSLDISRLTQFAADFTPHRYVVNGFEKSTLASVTFDLNGHVVGRFANGTERPIYKVPLAQFANPNGLEMKNGQVFAETPDSGTALVQAIDVSGRATLMANAREMSNVEIAQEFTRMILTQQAYNSSATVFRTVDEMTVVARDLKR